MARGLVTWLKIGVVLELIALAVIALLVVFDLTPAEGAKAAAVKVTLAIVVLAVTGGVLAALLGRAPTGKPQA